MAERASIHQERHQHMTIDATTTKLSFASTLHYAPDYLQRCARALDEALFSAPAYEAWRQLDPGPASPVFSRLAALPALTKGDLRKYGPQGFVPQGRDIAEGLAPDTPDPVEGSRGLSPDRVNRGLAPDRISRGLAAGEIELVTTSGTTDDQVTNVWYQPWWDASEAASWQLNAHARAVATGAHREAILTSPWCTGFPCEDGYLTREQRTLGRFLYLSERSDPSAWSDALMERMVDELNAFRPVVLEANPSFLARLSRYIVSRRLRVYSPKLIVLTYENPSVLHYRQIGRAFDAPIASSYGSTEAGYVFMECEAGRLHQVTASCHVDFLPFAPQHGGPDMGRILVTLFDNPWRSLVRFDVGDAVRLDTQAPCPCGRHEGLTLASVEGRTANLTRTPEGQAVTQGMVDRALSAVAGLEEYQLLQIGPFAYALHFVVEGAEPHLVAGAAREALKAVYGPAALITARPVEAIAPDPPGKYRLTRALAPPDPDALLDDKYAPRLP